MKKPTEPEMLSNPQRRPDATAVDVRSSDEYAAGHLPNAVNIPFSELEARRAELPSDRPVVTYCNMVHPGSSRGERAAELLQTLGFRASALDGGLPAWLNQAEKDEPGE